MGCSFSRPPRQQPQKPNQISSSSLPPSSKAAIRVVHLNGCVEDLLLPPKTTPRTVITARDVVGGSSDSATAATDKNVLCSSSQLRSMATGSFSPLPLDDPLRPDDLYFVLPCSLFHSDLSSPLDLASLANRLTAIASDPTTPIDVRYVGVETETTRWEGGRAKGWKPQLDSIEEVSIAGSLSRSSINLGNVEP